MDLYPKVDTSRLLLRELLYTDIPKIVEYAGNIKVAEGTLNIPHPYVENDAIFWLNSVSTGFKNRTLCTFGIRLKSTNEFIGGIGLKINNRFNSAELGYWVAEPFWSNGYATEAVAAVLKFGFEELNLNKIYAMHLVGNPASGKVMINNGMIKEGEFKDHTKKRDTYLSLIQYRLTKSEFEILK